jgi:hypothetical protein
MHVLVPLKQRDRLVGSLGYENSEAGIFQDVHAMHSTEHVTRFDDKASPSLVSHAVATLAKSTAR